MHQDDFLSPCRAIDNAFHLAFEVHGITNMHSCGVFPYHPIGQHVRRIRPFGPHVAKPQVRFSNHVQLFVEVTGDEEFAFRLAGHGYVQLVWLPSCRTSCEAKYPK